MLLMGLTEANQRFEEMQSQVRFIRDVSLGEEVYDVYQAKKKSGKPKDEEPSKLLRFLQSKFALLIILDE